MRGGIMIFIRDGNPSRLLTKHVFPDNIEGLFIELNFRKIQWLLLGTYHRPSQSDSYYSSNLDKGNYGSQIELVEKNEVLQDDDLISKKLNEFFKNDVFTLNIKENSFITNRISDNITDITNIRFAQILF